MKILVQNSDALVFYAGDDLSLTPDGLEGNGWRDPQFTLENAQIYDAVLPANWTGGVWSYLGGVWAVVNAAAHDNTLATLRDGLYTQIKAERDRRKFNGVHVSNKWIHTDTYSRTQWMGMVMIGANLPAIAWTTMDGTSITTTPALAGQVFQATATLDATLFAYAKSLIDAVSASNAPETVDITSGWPATFGGAL